MLHDLTIELHSISLISTLESFQYPHELGINNEYN